MSPALRVENIPEKNTLSCQPASNFDQQPASNIDQGFRAYWRFLNRKLSLPVSMMSQR